MKKKPEYVHNGLYNVPNIKIEYKGYTIIPKRDFGGQPYLNVNVYNKGYVITDGYCNVMPGGTWSHSIIEAKVMIDILIESKESGINFWDLLREKQGLAEWEEV